MNMLFTFLVIYTLSITSATAEELKPNEVSSQAVTVDKNKNGILPTYVNIDNTVEKSKTFSWGTVYYSSVTREDDHSPTSSDQTQLNIRYECKDSKSNSAKVQRFSFCGYAQSEIDTRVRNHQLSEIKKRTGNSEKTAAQLSALYDSEYNDRIVDPAWNITDASPNGRISIEITVRQKVGLYGACEAKVSNISIPVKCQ